MEALTSRSEILNWFIIQITTRLTTSAEHADHLDKLRDFRGEIITFIFLPIALTDDSKFNPFPFLMNIFSWVHPMIL